MGDNKEEMIQFSKDFLRETIAEEHKKLRLEIEKTITDKLDQISNTVSELNVTVTDLKKTANDAYEFSHANTEKINNIELRLQTLEETSAQQTKHTDELHHRQAGHKKDIDALKAVIDDQINRSMRCNLVFFGLKEDENANENYTTKSIVGEFIFNQLYEEEENVTMQGVLSTIVRAHRSKFNPNRDPKKGPRPIYVKFSRDDTAASYLKRSITAQVTKRGIRVKQQYTKELQERIDSALKVRRELFDKKKIKKAYVEYPATLKGILANSTEYTTIQVF